MPNKAAGTAGPGKGDHVHRSGGPHWLADPIKHGKGSVMKRGLPAAMVQIGKRRRLRGTAAPERPTPGVMAGAATFAGFSFASGWDLWYRGRWIRSPAQGSCQLIPEIGQLIQPDHDLVTRPWTSWLALHWSGCSENLHEFHCTLQMILHKMSYTFERNPVSRISMASNKGFGTKRAYVAFPCGSSPNGPASTRSLRREQGVHEAELGREPGQD
jgi:hypothetical protein